MGFAFSEPKAEIYGVGWPVDINQSSLAMKIERVLDSSKMVNLYKTVEENLATLNQRGHTSINLQVGEDVASVLTKQIRLRNELNFLLMT